MNQELTQPKRVYDDETGETVEITPIQQLMYNRVVQYYQANAMMDALILHKVKTEKIYLAGGYNSFKEFVQERTPIGYSTAMKRIKLAETFAPSLPKELFAKSGTGTTFENGNTNELFTEEAMEKLQHAQNVSSKRLQEIMRIEDADFSELFSQEAKVIYPDGTERKLADLNQISFEELSEERKRINEQTKRLKAQLERQDELLRFKESQLEQTKAEHEAEKAELAKREYDLKRKEAELEHKERKVGVKADTVERINQVIDHSNKLIADLNQALYNVDAPADLPDLLVNDLYALHGKILNVAENFKLNNAAIFFGAPETEAEVN